MFTLVRERGFVLWCTFDRPANNCASENPFSNVPNLLVRQLLFLSGASYNAMESFQFSFDGRLIIL